MTKVYFSTESSLRIITGNIKMEAESCDVFVQETVGEVEVEGLSRLSYASGNLELTFVNSYFLRVYGM